MKDRPIGSFFTTTLSIQGMTCGHCVQAVSRVLSTVGGVTVQSVTVGEAVIEAADQTVVDQALAALDRAGYPGKVFVSNSTNGGTTASKRGNGCCGGSSGGSRTGASGKTSGGCCG